MLYFPNSVFLEYKETPRGGVTVSRSLLKNITRIYSLSRYFALGGFQKEHADAEITVTELELGG